LAGSPFGSPSVRQGRSRESLCDASDGGGPSEAELRGGCGLGVVISAFFPTAQSSLRDTTGDRSILKRIGASAL